MGECLDVPQVAGETLILGIDLIGFNSGNIQEAGRLKRKKDAEKAIQKAVDKANKDITKDFLKGKTTTPDAAEQKVKDVGKAAGSAMSEHAQHKFTEGLSCAWRRSPLGVWVDENEWVMYIVVPVLVGGVAGGAGYMYYARVGDKPAGMLTSFVEPHLKFKPIGSLTLGLQDLEFKPSERKIEAKAFGTINWKPLEMGFSLTAGTADGDLTKLRLQNKFSYAGGGSDGNLKFNVHTFMQHDAAEGFSFGGGGGATYDFFSQALNMPLRLGAEASVQQNIAVGGGQKTVGTMLFTFGRQF